MRKFILFLVFLFFSLDCSTVQAPISTPASTVSPTVTPTSLFVFTPVVPTITPTPVIVTPTPTLSIPTPSGPIYYTVQLGDTLAQIADKFDIDMAGLARANKITDFDLIYSGQVLEIKTAPIIAPTPTLTEGKQIIVVLSTQRTYAYEDGRLLKEFRVGTGKAETPTVSEGPYKIEQKFEVADMSGDGYYIEDVLWIMYFYQGYGFHDAPWNPYLLQTSHGCVNMREVDAHWLFDWAPLGTPVLVYP